MKLYEWEIRNLNYDIQTKIEREIGLLLLFTLYISIQ